MPNKKKLLIKFLGNPKIRESEIEECDFRLFKYNGRYYHVEDLRRVVYGNPWYEQNYYQDFGKWRVSLHMYVTHGRDKYGNGSYGLHVGTEEVYRWDKRTYTYKPKTRRETKALTDNFINKMLKDYEKGGRTPDFDIETARKVVYYTLWQLFGDWLGTRQRRKKLCPH